MTNKELWAQLEEMLGGEETARRFRVWSTNVIRKELVKRSGLSSDEFLAHEATTILNDLNERTGCRYRLSDATLVLIKGRLADGFTVGDFIKVHEVKCAKWLGKDSFEDNLRPSTLYRPSHFHEYHAEWFAWDRKRTETQARRKAAAPPKLYQENPGEREQLIAKLMAKSWDSFDTWAELIRWTIQFPDAQSLENYPMPVRIRKMRTAPGMYLQVLKDASPEWAEEEYQQIKKGVKE